MKNVDNNEFDRQTQALLDWQLDHAPESDLDVLQSTLIKVCQEQLEKASQKSWYHDVDCEQRRAYIQALSDAFHHQNKDAFVKLIEHGLTEFNRDDEDLRLVLKRSGEAVLLKWHAENKKVYRRDTYALILEAEEVCKIANVRRERFKYEVHGDVKRAFALLKKAINTADSTYLGPAEAHFQIGMMYLLHLLDDVDSREMSNRMAVHHFEQAAERQHKASLLKLAHLALTGRGYPKAEKKQAIDYLRQYIGMDIHMWGEAIEYVLQLVDRGDEYAIAYLKEKLNAHKAAFLQNIDNVLAFAKENGSTALYKEASNYTYGSSYLVASKAAYKAGISHLRQIHHIADSGDTDVNYRFGGYVFAKAILCSIYAELAQECDRKQIPHDFHDISAAYEKRMADQIEAEKPKEKTPQEKIENALKEDDIHTFKQLVAERDCSGKHLLRAATYASENIVDYLLECGVKDRGALAQVCINFGVVEPRLPQRLRIVKRLIKAGIDVNEFVGGDDYTALHNATLSECPALMILLLEAGAQVDGADDMGRTPLALLIEQHTDQVDLETAEILLQAGADINAYNKCGSRPCGMAKSNRALMRLLMQYGTPDEKQSKQEMELQKFLSHIRQFDFIKPDPQTDEAQADDTCAAAEKKSTLPISQIKLKYCKTLYQAGVGFFKKQLYSHALEWFQLSLALTEDNGQEQASCFYSLASTYLHLEQYEKAFEASQHCVTLRPHDKRTLEKHHLIEQFYQCDQLEQQARALLASERYQEAMVLFEKVVSNYGSLEPKSNRRSHCQLQQVHCHRQLGQIEKALDIANRVLVHYQVNLGFNKPETCEVRKLTEALRAEFKQASHSASVGLLSRSSEVTEAAVENAASNSARFS